LCGAFVEPPDKPAGQLHFAGAYLKQRGISGNGESTFTLNVKLPLETGRRIL
jgi:hypothetical protein